MWRSTTGGRGFLDAKFAIARERGKDVTYSALRVEGARVYLTTTDRSADPQLGELRVIRSTTGRFVRGEVEAIEGNAVVFYVNEGNPDDLPRKGVLAVDAERTVSKLRREQDAVRRVFEGRAVRADLKDILSNPAVNPLPAKYHVEEFVQDHLDDAKRNAVASVLGAQGISLVKGPPGTGRPRSSRNSSHNSYGSSRTRRSCSRRRRTSPLITRSARWRR